MLWSGVRKGSSSSFNDAAPKKPLMLKGSVGDELEHLDKDRAIKTDPSDTRNRRTIKLIKKNESWGFALQTYGVRNKRTNEIEVMTYVDYVDYNGPAWIAGLQRGDIFLSINGEPVEGATHQQLVEKIRKVGDTMRLVVLFEDCCRKVELYEKFIKLKQVLSAKLTHLQELKMKENAILKRCGINRTEEMRGSMRSTRSSMSNDWDRFSVLGNSMSLRSIPNHIREKRRLYTANYDSSSDISINNSFNDSLSDSDGSAFLSSSNLDVSQSNPQIKIENVDSASEYSLPLHSNFQLGGKLLTFSEDDSGSVSSFEHVESGDKSCDRSCDMSCDPTPNQSVDSEQNSICSSTRCDTVPKFINLNTETEIESCDQVTDQSVNETRDQSSENSTNQSVDMQSGDQARDNPTSQSESSDQTHGQASGVSHVSVDQSETPKNEGTQKRFKDGILINEEDMSTRL